MHHSLDLECPESGFQNGADIEWIDSINPDPVNVLADVYLAVVVCYCNAPPEQGLRSTKSVIRKKNILCDNPAPLRVIVAPLGNPVWLYGKVNPGIPDIDDLQVTHRTARAELS